jgi:lysozyme
MNGSYTDAVKRFEGFAPRASWDYKQHSNGYGTKAQYPGEVIDRATAESRFANEWSKAQSSVNQFAPNAPEGVKAALTSLTFNAGPGWQSAGLGNAVQSGDYDAAKQHFLQYNKAGGQVNDGLVSRRQQEAGWFGGAPDQGALTGAIMPSPTTVFPAARGIGTGALSASSQLGPGALGENPDANPVNTVGSGMQEAGAFLSGISDPRYLSALTALKQPDDNYSVIQGKDGNLYRVSKKTGAVTAVRQGSGETTMPVTPGQKSADEAYAKDFNDWTANGGFATSARGLDELRGVSKALKEEKDLSGPFMGNLPDSALAVTNPRALEIKQKVASTIQNTMRPILGAQFTEKEGENLIARAYDPRLDQAQNAAKIDSLITQLDRQAKAKQAAAEHFQRHGSLVGWNGTIPAAGAISIEDAATAAPAAKTNGGFKVLKVH